MSSSVATVTALLSNTFSTNGKVRCKIKLKVFALYLIIALLFQVTVCRKHYRRLHRALVTTNISHRYITLESASQTKCLKGCSCKWRSGKMTVDCIDSGFIEIPNDLDSGTQVLRLDGNVIKRIGSKAFQKVGLSHLQKIFMARCGLVQIEGDAFSQVSNLIEIDLSNNFLAEIPFDSLHQCPLLRKLLLSHNPITAIFNNTFATLTQLQTLDLSEAKIEHIDVMAFQGLKNLRHLQLNDNRLRHLSGSTVQSLSSLHELTLHNNPWQCDCRLRQLRDWMLQNNIPLSYSPQCSTPKRLEGHTWNSLSLEEFACTPAIVSIDTSIVVYEGENASLGCTITSIPASRVEWQWRGRSIRNMSLLSFGRQMYLIKEGAFGQFERSSTLYIMNVLEKDAGSYTCVGENRAGIISANLTLTVTKRRGGVSSYSGEEVAGMVLGAMLIFLIIFIAICFVVLRSKTHYNEATVINANSIVTSDHGGHDERKPVLSVMNHSSVTNYQGMGNHLEMSERSKDASAGDTRKQMENDDDHVKCLDTDSYSNGAGLSNSGYQSVHNTSVPDDHLGYHNHNQMSMSVTDPPQTDVPQMNPHPRTVQDILQRRRSDITEELKQRFQQQQHQQQGHHGNNNSAKDHHVVRFSNKKPTVYNYNTRMGHSMESLEMDNAVSDSEPNQHQQSSHHLQGHNQSYYHGLPLTNYNHNGASAMRSSSLAGLSYTLRPSRIASKQWSSRRSGGSLAALLAIDARDSPDEGLGDEREYETDIFD